jgi:hypothetical protein
LSQKKKKNTENRKIHGKIKRQKQQIEKKKKKSPSKEISNNRGGDVGFTEA